jgi:CRISPR-associated endonuclease Cas2
MPYMIAYDIEDNRLRLKVAGKLIECGFLRLQKSVFAGDPRDTTLDRLQKWLKKMAPVNNAVGYFVLILPCTDNQIKSAVLIGQTAPEWNELAEPQNTLII